MERKLQKQKVNIKSSGKIKLPINFIHYSLALKHIFMLPQDLMQSGDLMQDGSMKKIIKVIPVIKLMS